MATNVERIAFDLGGDVGDMMVAAALSRALIADYQDLATMPVPQTMRHLLEILAAHEAENSDQSPKIALIVEDDARDRERAAALLKELGLNAVEADSAEVAVALMERQGGEVAILLTEIPLAGLMNGVDLARAVAVLWPRTKVLVTSDFIDRSPRLPSSVQYLQKPWRGLDVIAATQDALQNPPPAVA
jgi:CheY-like chemotaxis protein